MYYGPESLKSEGMLAVEITENERQQRTTSEIRHLINFWTIQLASLDQTNYLTNLREGRAYFGGLREGLRMGGEGSPTAVGTTAMKTPEFGGLQGTDRAVTTCRLPQRFHGLEHTF